MCYDWYVFHSVGFKSCFYCSHIHMSIQTCPCFRITVLVFQSPSQTSLRPDVCLCWWRGLFCLIKDTRVWLKTQTQAQTDIRRKKCFFTWNPTCGTFSLKRTISQERVNTKTCGTFLEQCWQVGLNSDPICPIEVLMLVCSLPFVLISGILWFKVGT